jgi:hypothetical protein
MITYRFLTRVIIKLVLVGFLLSVFTRTPSPNLNYTKVPIEVHTCMKIAAYLLLIGNKCNIFDLWFIECDRFYLVKAADK